MKITEVRTDKLGCVTVRYENKKREYFVIDLAPADVLNFIDTHEVADIVFGFNGTVKIYR